MNHLYRIKNNYIECSLCPHYCKIAVEKTGICGVRKNTGRKIELMTYGVVSGYAIDPIEKKPLYHFYPGRNILSIGSYGCNMGCDYCQNYHISQQVPYEFPGYNSPQSIVDKALTAENNIGVAFTYNEPVIWFEFMKDTAVTAKDAGLNTVMVSNGYVNSEPLSEMIQFIDAFNIDLKAFKDDFYRKFAGAGIEPVKNCLKQISRSGRHLEITTLIIPGLNDDEEEMSSEATWIATELGKHVPLHLSRYFPMYKRNDLSTPDDTLTRLFETASKKLDNVYIGNAVTGKGQNTICTECGTTVTIRSGFLTELLNLDSEGKCTACGNQVYRYFTFSLKR